jgi:hypothetical protein
MISIFALYFLSLAYTAFFVLYTKYQIIDEDDGAGWTDAETKWHRYGLLMRLTVALMGAAWVYLPAPNPVHFFIALPLAAAAFDLGINIARGRPIFDLGKGGWDAKIGIWKWVLYAAWFITTCIIAL